MAWIVVVPPSRERYQVWCQSSLGLAVQASGVSANLPGDGASAASGRQPEAASAG
jgi:hypothetical protein